MNAQHVVAAAPVRAVPGSGPGGMAGDNTCHTPGSTDGVGAETCKVAPTPTVCGGASSSLREGAHTTSGETVGKPSRGRPSSSISSAVREEKLSTPTSFNFLHVGAGKFLLAYRRRSG